MIILGLDVGGANTKAALVNFKNSEIIDTISYLEYFPFWEKTLDDILGMFERILKRFSKEKTITSKDITYISITITAELSDAFQTKREGISTILSALEQIFEKDKMFFINNECKFLNFYQVKTNQLSIAAANWVSTALFLGNFLPECILIDGGSTTIDVIPILNSIPVTKGKDDLTRIINHELIYTGGLRATIPSITHFVPYKEKLVRISFERFALISDIHRILNNITEKEYINDTADNRSKSLNDCYARLSRIICMDIETISKEDLDIIAKYIYEKQIHIISYEIKEFIKELIHRFPQFLNNPKFVITGLSADFLIRKALEGLGYTNISSFREITQIPDNTSSSAFAVAGALNLQL